MAMDASAADVTALHACSQSGVMIAVKKMSLVALLNNNATNGTSPTRGSRPDNVYMATNTGGTCKASPSVKLS